MNSTIKQVLFALGAATTMMMSAAAPAQASDCSSCDGDSLIEAVDNLTAEISALQVLQDVNVNDVWLVDVDDALNGDLIDILTFNKSLNLNYVKVILLQTVLSNFTLIDNGEGGTLIDAEDFLNENDVGIHDVVAVDVLNDNDIVIFHK